MTQGKDYRSQTTEVYYVEWYTSEPGNLRLYRPSVPIPLPPTATVPRCQNVSILYEVRRPVRTERSGASKSIVVAASSTDTQITTTWKPPCW